MIHEELDNFMKSVEKSVTDESEYDYVLTKVHNGIDGYLKTLVHKLSATTHFKALITYDLDKINLNYDQDILDKINLNIDSFCFSAMSALDVIHRIVTCLYCNAFPGILYFHKNSINGFKKKCCIETTMKDIFVIPDWFNSLKDYRDAYTHEVIPFVKEDHQYSSIFKKKTIFMPRNPKDFIYRDYKNLTIDQFLSIVYKGLETFVSELFKHIILDKNSFRKLPFYYKNEFDEHYEYD